MTISHKEVTRIIEGEELNTQKVLHILRNPWGYQQSMRREAALAAADELEWWKAAFESLKKWAEKNGLDAEGSIG